MNKKEQTKKLLLERQNIRNNIFYMTEPTILVVSIFKAFDSAREAAALALEPMLKVLLLAYWKNILIFIVLLLLVKIIEGRFGSAIYNTIYFGILFLILVIAGLKILFNPYFDIIYASLYPVSYLLTGLILKRIRH